MAYLKFLCIGLGLLSLVAGMICGLVALVSDEAPIKAKAKHVAMGLLPLAVLLLSVGLGVLFGVAGAA